MSGRNRIAHGLSGQRHIIELSAVAYKEILDKLIEAGYDWLVWPDMGQIPMDGFVVRSIERRSSP